MSKLKTKKSAESRQNSDARSKSSSEEKLLLEKLKKMSESGLRPLREALEDCVAAESELAQLQELLAMDVLEPILPLEPRDQGALLAARLGEVVALVEEAQFDELSRHFTQI